MSLEYMCTNCYWSGSQKDMDHEDGRFSCPDCCAEFFPYEPERGPWEPLWPDGEPDFSDDSDDWK